MSDAPVSVLVTRPAAQAGSWVAAAKSAGWEVVTFPTLEIRPLEISPEQRQWVLDLDRYQGVICISANAAEIGLALLADYWPQWPVRQDWYAVGPATAEVMTGYHLQPLVPEVHHSEGLLGLPTLQEVAGQRFLIIKGQGGRDAIQAGLRARGAIVDELPLYERVIPAGDPGVVRHWLQQERCHFLAFSSGDGLKHFLHMCGTDVADLSSVPVVVVSERLADYARQQGFHRVLLAQGASSQALVAAISTALNA